MEATRPVAGLTRDDRAIIALGMLLPVAGLLISSAIAEGLAAFDRSGLAAQVVGWAIHDAIYRQIARDHLTYLTLAYDQLAPAPWGLAVHLEGTVLAKTVVALGTGFILLALGLVASSLRPTLRGLLAVKLLTVVGYHLAATNTLLRFRLTADTAEKMGLAAAITKLGGNDARAYQMMVGTLEILFPVGLLALAHVYVVARWWHRGARANVLPSTAAIVAALAIAALSPPAGVDSAGAAALPARAEGPPGAQPAQVESHRPAAERANEQPTRPEPRAAAPARPPRVELRRTDGGWVLLRDGEPMTIKGMGYSALVGETSREGRRRKWAEDFQLIAANGFNTVVSWEDKDHRLPWTRALLDLAHAAGLAVIVPFYLPSTAIYADADVRASYRAKVAEWVLAFRDHPALLMWGLGNEVLHGIGLERPAAAAAFASFYWELADLVHELDPHHPVTYRGGEEHYIGPLIAAYRRTGVERPWFAYGLNVYNAGPRPLHLRRVLYELWPARAWPVAAYVSEFNALGLDAQERPKALLKMWRVIQERPGAFLGGAVYTWSTTGPEVLDRSFGLVDGQNRPVDRALEMLREEFRSARPSLRQSSSGAATAPDD